MTVLTEQILHHFDRLSTPDQLEIAVAILKRLVNFDFPALTDEDLVLNAEALFLALDYEEAEYEQS